MRVLVTGGTGVLGCTFRPLAVAAGHDVRAPGRAELDLFDPLAVGAAVRDVDAVLHLATRIQPLDKMGQPGAWRENDRLRAEASAILVDAALAADVKTFVQPTVTFVYPGDRPVSEETPLGDVPVILRSALAAEHQAARFAMAGRRGVVLRLGLHAAPAPARTSRTRAWEPRCTPRTPPARCWWRSMSPAACITCAAERGSGGSR